MSEQLEKVKEVLHLIGQVQSLLNDEEIKRQLDEEDVIHLQSRLDKNRMRALDGYAAILIIESN
jgi:hypothetical protein